MKLYLNPDVLFKSKKTFSCIYHITTGWYYPCKPDFWKTLQSYKGGRRVEPQKLTPALTELINNRFLIQNMASSGIEAYQDFYPIRMPETIYYLKDSVIDIAVERKGAHDELDFDIVSLEGIKAELWRLCDGTQNLKEITQTLGAERDELFTIIKWWVSVENQLLRLTSEPITTFSVFPPQLLHKVPFLSKKDTPKTFAKDVHKYHLETIKNGAEQFDRVESTLSHLYRAPHPILNWRSYGQALYTKIDSEKEIQSGMRLLEIGGGAGNISSDLLLELKKDEKGVEYIIYDLSPALIRSQIELHKTGGVKASHINGNGEILALADACVDIALSNEVIADFYTPEVPTKDVKEFLFDHEIPMSKEFFYCYDNAPEKVRVNLGAFMLLKELYRVLKPGGLAVITEFGYQDRLPFRARHLDHAEYSIQFAQMVSVAAAIGFNLHLTDAFDFLGFRDDVKLITAASYQAVFRLMEHNNTYLPNMTYTEDMLTKQLGKKAKNIKGTQFVEPQKDPFKIVKIMVCRKPHDTNQNLQS